MLGIMAGMYHKDSYALLVDIDGHAWLVLMVTLHLALCFFPCRQGQDALHLCRYGSEGLACLQGRQHPCRGEEAFPMVQT